MRVEEEKARAYYIEECSKQNWSSRTLERQIKTNTYQRLLSTQKEVDVELSSSNEKTFGLLKIPMF